MQGIFADSQIESVARQQNVSLNVAGGEIPVFVRADVGGFPRINHHHRAFSRHLEGVIRFYNDRRGFVDADANEVRMFQHDAEQSIEPLSLDEMLVDDGVGHEAETPDRLGVVSLDEFECIRLVIIQQFFAGDHHLAHDGGAGAGAADGRAAGVKLLQFLMNGRINDGRCEL